MRHTQDAPRDTSGFQENQLTKPFPLTQSETRAKTLFFFGVADMICSTSAGAVARALKHLDEEAKVQIDLPMRRVEVETTNLVPSAMRDAICRAGFTPLRQWPSALLLA
jgi:copper chaperone CopZ